MSVEQNRAIGVRIATDGWGTNPGWEKVFDELLMPDAIWFFDGLPEPIRGLEEIKSFYQGLYQSFPNIYITKKDIIADESGVMVRCSLKGTQKGEFMGIAPTNHNIEITDISFFRVSDGKVVEWWYEINLLSVLKQLGMDIRSEVPV
jgi:predicted SnoaL-like aldol condensation-catalyzing enzyme